MGLTAPKPQIIFEIKIHVLHIFNKPNQGDIDMTVKEFRAISSSTVLALTPVYGAVYAHEYDVFHNRTGNNYAFSDGVNAEDREIDFVEAEQEVGFDEPVIYVYTK